MLAAVLIAAWPDAALRVPDRVEDTPHDLNPQWFGVWRAPDATRITVSAAGFAFGKDRAAWSRHDYAWSWASAVQARIAAGAPAALAPGRYIAYAPPPVTDAQIVADIDLARDFLRAQDRLDAPAAHALDGLRAAAQSIHPGTYRRVMRFCLNPPHAAADCAPVDLLSYFILDGDRLIRVDLPLVAPEEGRITAYTRE